MVNILQSGFKEKKKFPKQKQKKSTRPSNVSRYLLTPISIMVLGDLVTNIQESLSPRRELPTPTTQHLWFYYIYVSLHCWTMYFKLFVDFKMYWKIPCCMEYSRPSFLKFHLRLLRFTPMAAGTCCCCCKQPIRCHDVFTHPPADGHLGFQLSPSATRNILSIHLLVPT